jgi:Domain of unknown function (DUF4288)
MPTDRPNDADRYSAKLLFEFHVTVGGKPMFRRTCEERIIIVHASSARGALREAMRRGMQAQFRFRNTYGDPGHFRLVGIMDLLHLGLECEADEVWYDITERVRPSERRRFLLPATRDLHAFREERVLRGPRRGRVRKKALSNNEMQLTRSARARRRGPRS